MKVCCRCHESEATRNQGSWCVTCCRKYYMEYRSLHPDIRNRAPYVRQRYLGVRKEGVNGTRYVCAPGKRPWTDTCEICGSKPKRTVYHHWDDTNFARGMWICQPCHNTAHAVEKGIHAKYLALKQRLSTDA